MSVEEQGTNNREQGIENHDQASTDSDLSGQNASSSAVPAATLPPNGAPQRSLPPRWRTRIRDS